MNRMKAEDGNANKVGKVGKVSKVSKVGEVSKVGKVSKVSKVGRPRYYDEVDEEQKRAHLIKVACKLYGKPYDDRYDRYDRYEGTSVDDHNEFDHTQRPDRNGKEVKSGIENTDTYDHRASLREVADIMKISPAKVKRLLIDGGYYSTAQTREIQRLVDAGVSIKEIAERLQLAERTVKQLMPYRKGVYGIDSNGSLRTKSSRVKSEMYNSVATENSENSETNKTSETTASANSTNSSLTTEKRKRIMTIKDVLKFVVNDNKLLVIEVPEDYKYEGTSILEIIKNTVSDGKLHFIDCENLSGWGGLIDCCTVFRNASHLKSNDITIIRQKWDSAHKPVIIFADEKFEKRIDGQFRWRALFYRGEE